MSERIELAIVGAGPAGIEAAIAAAATGVSVALVDSYPRPGGQYFRQLPAPFSASHDTVHDQKARAIFRRLERTNVRLLNDTLVWGAFPAQEGEGWLLTLYGPDAPRTLRAGVLILATGAYDRPIPFPGWTLPGVMTAGAVQNLIESQRVLPGRRILLSGTGPLQLAVADRLIHAGAEVVDVLEGSPVAWRAIRYAPALWGQWARLREGWDYWRTLRRAGVPLRLGWSVVAARGDEEVQEAVIARLDDAWRPIPGSRKTLTVDSVVIGYGFIPSTALSRLLGCEHDFKPEQGGYVPRRDGEMQTSRPGVYAVGDGAGVGGAELARIEGRISGIAAARRLGHLDEETARVALSRQRTALARERRFARMLGALFTPGPGLYTLATDDTIICRCEEVRLGDVRRAVAAGARTVNEVKGITRAGMGNCQGRICGELVARAVAAEIGVQDIESVGVFTARPPIHPLPLSVLAEYTQEVH